MNTDSGAHLVSISHDPMEDGDSAPRYRGRDARSEDLYAYSMPAEWSDRHEADHSQRHSMRPLLLAGAIGLFAAWAVSGMNLPGWGSGVNDRGRRLRRPIPAQPRRNYDAPRRAVAGGERHGLPPEGESSPEEFSLDAMNP